MPEPIRTPKTQGVYGAPPGREAQIGGLPFYREDSGIGVPAVYSVWTFTDQERAWIAKGHANLVVGIVGMEPIPPISLALREGPAFEAPGAAAPPGPPDPPRPGHSMVG
jgi:hypothetical protein